MSDKKSCPVCEEPVEPMDENDAFPFCSKRCKQVDLGRWFSEDYGVPLTPQTSDRAMTAEDAEDPDETS